MKKKVAVVTEGRMTYGLLYWTLKELENHPSFELHIIATGSHLSKARGLTIREIENGRFTNVHSLVSIEENDTGAEINIAKSMSRIMNGLSDIFAEIRPDLMVILGDRYELLAAASVATVMNIPTAHICGGEISEGAIDEQIRHALTKLSHLHFTGCKEYQQNVINLGENPQYVFNVGEPAIENFKRLSLLDKREILSLLNIKEEVKPIFLVTYHPVTLEGKGEQKIEQFISALEEFDGIKIISAPNQDFEGNLFLKKLKAYADNTDNVYFFPSLGVLKYLSVMKNSDVIVGNSSSGIIETPSFKIPTVNIGNRQQGRLRSANIIDCTDDKAGIVAAIKKALSQEFRASISHLASPFGEGKTSSEILKKLVTISDYKLLLKKSLNWKNEY